MSVIERLFHAVLFEVLAVLFSILGLVLLTDHPVSSLSGTMIAVATIAMAWNMIFNAIFDRFFPGDREARGFIVRCLQVVAFEGGLLLITVPLMAWMLNVSLWQAFMMDIGVTIFIAGYAFAFNYCYDHLRAAIIRRRQLHSTAVHH
ncbi:PACE efflux transporter [Photobacterium nomapromontoriensis]|uniref:PACE efflux transporter n=1 Tax=Photobacterium nomapromontoriensis TaxID=2910237 RepID=UPI003D11DE00